MSHDVDGRCAETPTGSLTKKKKPKKTYSESWLRVTIPKLILVSTTVLLGYTVLIPEELSLDMKLSKQYLYPRLPGEIA